MRRLNSVAALLLSGLITGCANMGLGEKQYACPGRPDGFTCKSALEVYELTDGDDWTSEIEAQRASDDSGGTALPPRATLATRVVPVSRPALPEMNTGAIPLRTPARVVRIWIAPWEDEEGDLHMPGLVYTEIEKRRWQVGLPQTDERGAIRPLETP